MQRKLRGLVVGVGLLAALCGGIWLISHRAVAQSAGEFYVQVSPSPLVATLKPGETTTLELNVRNYGSATENLRIVPRAFQFKSDSQQVKLNDTEPPEIASWISFGNPTFTLQASQTITQRITIDVPEDAGFSYSFALLINRINTPANTEGQTLKGSIAVFSLINIDRPGAKRSLEVVKFKPTQDIYEYLPATLDVQMKNTGNTIVQPGGTIFVQRGAADKKPLDTLALNDAHAYILPGTSRTLSVQWANGFQVLQPIEQADGSTKDELKWDWSKLGDIRFGQYTAKLIAIYNDGKRDIPVEGEVTFWVIPWKILIGVLVVVILIGAGIWSFVRKAMGLGKKMKRYR